MSIVGKDVIHGGIDKYWLDERTSVHWVNENSCLLQIESNIVDINDALIDANQRVQQWTADLSRSMPTWLENYVPAYTSLLIIHDLRLADKFLVLNWLKQSQNTLHLTTGGNRSGPEVTASRHHTVEVCYSLSLSDALLQHQQQIVALPNDLELVSQHVSLPLADIIQRHTDHQYRVFTVGFLPNFAYMGLTHSSINMPRLKKPRKRVPAGAVAIADNQTAIYPQVSPGGWHILGYTPCNLSINGKRKFKAGDTVSFKAISESEYCQRILSGD